MANLRSTSGTATVVLAASAGTALAVTELFGAVGSLGIIESTIALTVLVAPLAYAGHRIASLKPRPTDTQTDDATEMDAEKIRQGTEQWSGEQLTNPAFPPGYGPNQQASSLKQDGPRSSGDNYNSKSIEPTNRDREHNQRSSSVNSSNLEFAWQTKTDVSFDDIGGMEDIKNQLRTEVIQPIENPEKAEELGVAAPNLIFYGPPGTGKTFTAEALATELGLPIAELSGADLQSKWINESASTVNDLFSEAREVAAREGGAIVFLDELDSVLKNRSGSESSHEEDNKVVNEFLNHLEETKDHGIIFVGATNRLDALDDAGVRSGRIDLRIEVEKPDAEARAEVLRAQLSDREHEIPDAGIEQLARATDGAVAADLELLVNRAAKNVLTRDGDMIQWKDFE